MEDKETYYAKNRQRIHEYYELNKAELKQKALQRYYKNRQKQIDSGQIVAKRLGRPTNRFIDPTPPIFKIERLDKTNLSQ